MAEYVITDGKRFIFRNHAGKYLPVSCEAMADRYSKKQADMIYKNQLPKTLKSVFHIEKYDSPPNGVKQVNDKDIQNTEKLICSKKIQQWIDKISNLNGLFEEASARKEILAIDLSKVDKELSDINHYIEFANLNAAQGYKASRMIKERRVKRRSIKNELNLLDMILNKRLEESLSEEIDQFIKTMDKRTYEPRVLKELFDL